MNKDELIEELKKIKIEINNDMLTKLDKYYEILTQENTKYNLTRIINKKDVYLKHFYDSLTINKIIDLDNQYILDIGSGAGFPGLVLKIIFPNIKIDLLDSTTKKCQFIEKVIKELQLENINVINDRAEEYAKYNREKYDIVVSRAVAPLKHLLEYSIPTLKVGGIFVSLKSNISEEIKNIEVYYKKLFLKNEKIESFYLPHNEGYRTIYKIQKSKKTPNNYPRKYSQIKKNSL